MTLREDHYTFRDSLVEAVVRNLVGPSPTDDVTPSEELLDEPPMGRYIAGALYPIRGENVDNTLDPEHDVDLVEQDEDGRVDPPIALANVRYPSALGISFAVSAAEVGELEFRVDSARYTPEMVDFTRETEEELPPEADAHSAEVWRRSPLKHEYSLGLSGSKSDTRTSLGDGLELFVREREPDERGRVAVTAAVINTLEVPAGEWKRDAYTFFQVALTVTEKSGNPVFMDRSSLRGDGADGDARSFALLYRHSPTFATGHGCSAEWEAAEVSDSDDLRALTVRSTVTPSHELLLADNNPLVVSPYFSMRRLAEGDRDEICSGLRAFVDGYDSWIGDRQNDVASLGPSWADTANRHLVDCELASKRMKSGIDLLQQDAVAWEAFQLANRAMLMQRARSDWARDKAQGEAASQPDLSGDVHNWRAFQLGFILIALAGIADPESDDREIVDLLWFPTGGGKTEAYLGLIAFTVFLRRLRGHVAGDGGGGLTVIMRYTLRLLTLQQFERASMLMCACESIRRTRSDLGQAEISICLWVGSAATPNNLADARKALKDMHNGKTLREKNPVQLRSCSWCAEPLSYKNYFVADHNPRLVITCRNEACEFEKGLPCYVVDEDIYNQKPTLMIATVDKFASLPWREDVGPLFNMDGDVPPPELIIQDELHLISGPLGTMVGLYESAINMLCDDGGIGPKVIASTATIRRAEEQIGQLYASEGFQFPPPGLDARDSYFAVEVPREAKGTRRYLGLLAPGTSHATLLVRTYSALLELAHQLDAPDEVKDPYWTLLGYFNSLRVLGGALLQVQDDVVDRVAVLAKESGREPRFESPELREMTSRVDSSSIPSLLKQMGYGADHPDCLDVMLATNMISVGVDVDRLGLMAVMGQPQSSSEYIQATSRVGRRHPGLVVALFNAARSRDRSHYEDFVAFHQSIYRQVDASSVTPFAARARDRGLHAVFIGMMRARYSEFRSNSGAAQVANLEARAQPVIDRIVERVQRVDPEQSVATEKVLHQVVEEWKRKAEEVTDLVFANRRKPEKSLLVDAGRDHSGAEGMPTMWSLRAVDTESNLYLLKGKA